MSGIEDGMNGPVDKAFKVAEGQMDAATPAQEKPILVTFRDGTTARAVDSAEAAAMKQAYEAN